MSKCKKCKFWIFSVTLGSPNIPIWHCSHGFVPYPDCIIEAEYAEYCKKLFYKRHPEYLQLKLNF